MSSVCEPSVKFSRDLGNPPQILWKANIVFNLKPNIINVYTMTMKFILLVCKIQISNFVKHVSVDEMFEANFCRWTYCCSRKRNIPY